MHPPTVQHIDHGVTVLNRVDLISYDGPLDRCLILPLVNGSNCEHEVGELSSEAVKPLCRFTSAPLHENTDQGEGTDHDRGSDVGWDRGHGSPVTHVGSDPIGIKRPGGRLPVKQQVKTGAGNPGRGDVGVNT